MRVAPLLRVTSTASCTETSAVRDSGAKPRAASASIFRDDKQRARFIAGVLSWLDAQIDFFDPPQEDAIAQIPERIVPGRSRKAFGELGLALRLAQRASQLREREEIRRLKRAWLRMSRERDIFFDARRRVHLVPLMAVALTVCAALDQVPESPLRSLQTVLDRHFLDRTELAAHPKLDLKYYLDCLGLKHAFDNDAVLFRRSSLTNPAAIPYARRIDFYAITHLIFHLSDFAARDMQPICGRHFDGIREYLALALATSLTERDFDLAGEFLIARLCLGVRDDALNRAACDVLCEIQQPAGFIPDQAWLAGLKPRDDPRQRAEEEFFAVYHPTLVALILAACDLSLPFEMNS